MYCKISEKTSGEFEQFRSQCCCCTWYQRTCGIFILGFIVSLVCCAYCTIVLYQIRDLSVSCKVNEGNTQRGGIKKAEEDINTFTQVDQENTNDVHMYNSTPRRTKRDVKKKSKRTKIVAGHYEQRASHEYFRNFSGYDHDIMIETCKYVDELKGRLCKTGDFKSNTKTLHVFKPASYLKPKSSPFKSTKNGKFTAKKKGIYLVYAQVLFYDNKEFQEIKVKHWKKDNSVANEYSCVRSVRGIDKNVNNTCSVTALFFLGRGDYLTVELFDTELNLNFLHRNTFLGAVLLK